MTKERHTSSNEPWLHLNGAGQIRLGPILESAFELQIDLELHDAKSNLILSLGQEADYCRVFVKNVPDSGICLFAVREHELAVDYNRKLVPISTGMRFSIRIFVNCGRLVVFGKDRFLAEIEADLKEFEFVITVPTGEETIATIHRVEILPLTGI